MGAKSTALGLNTDAAKEGLAATTGANQMAADRTLQGTTAGQQLTFAGQNQQLATDNAAKDKVDANLNNLQAGAANFGQGFANTAGQAAQVAATAGQAGISGLATAAGAGNALTSTTLSGMDGGYKAAQIGQSGALGLAGANTSQYNAESNAVNNAIKTGTSTAGSLFGAGNAQTGIISTKKAKKNRTPVDPDAIMAGLESAMPEGYDYKEGMGSPGRKVGAMAEDLNAEFGDDVAPGGKMVNVQNMIGLQHAALVSVSRRLAKLEGGKRA
jgi:hypothetical protein